MQSLSEDIALLILLHSPEDEGQAEICGARFFRLTIPDQIQDRFEERIFPGGIGGVISVQHGADLIGQEGRVRALDLPELALQIRRLALQGGLLGLDRGHALPEEREVILSQLQQLIEAGLLAVGARQGVPDLLQSGFQHLRIPARDVLRLIHRQPGESLPEIIQDLSLYQGELCRGTAPGPGAQEVVRAFHGHPLHILSAVGAFDQACQGAAHGAVIARGPVPTVHDGLHLIV